MSASRRPTRCPRIASARARFRLTVDLPTPPLPLATATIFTEHSRGVDAPPSLEHLARLEPEKVDAGAKCVRRARHRLDREGTARDLRLRIAAEELHVAPVLVGPDDDVVHLEPPRAFEGGRVVELPVADRLALQQHVVDAPRDVG